MPGRITNGVLVAGTRLGLLAEKFLSTAGRLCPSRYRYGTILIGLVFGGVVLAGFKGRANAFLLDKSNLSFCLLYFLFSFPTRVGCVGLGSSN